MATDQYSLKIINTFDVQGIFYAIFEVLTINRNHGHFHNSNNHEVRGSSQHHYVVLSISPIYIVAANIRENVLLYVLLTLYHHLLIVCYSQEVAYRNMRHMG